MTDLYQYELVFCKDSTSEFSEYINIKSELNGGVIVKVGTINLNVADISYTVGDFWPSEAQKTQRTQLTYSIDADGAVLTGGTPDPDFWQLDTFTSSRESETSLESLFLVLTRSEANPGIA